MKSFLRVLFRLSVSLAIILGCQNLGCQNLGLLAATGLVLPPSLESTGRAITKQLGDFGESFVDAVFRARGFHVVDGNLGGHGIDRIAVKYGPNSQIVEVRFIEVKTRQGLPQFQLNLTEDGYQLSEKWIKSRLNRLARQHPDPSLRSLCKKLIEIVETSPSRVHSELHGLSLPADEYSVFRVDKAGRLIKDKSGQVLKKSEGRITSLLKMLSKRGTTPEIRQTATRILADYDQIAAARAYPTDLTLDKVVTEGVQKVRPRTKLTTNRPTTTTTVIVEDAPSAQCWLLRTVKQPGVAAGGITFVIDEGFTAWKYYKGTLNKADFQQQTVQNTVKAASVGMAIQLVYFLAPTPHGLVVIGVGIVAYAVSEQAIAAYDKTFTPQSPRAVELHGMIPSSFLEFPMLDDVATGKRVPLRMAP